MPEDSPDLPLMVVEVGSEKLHSLNESEGASNRMEHPGTLQLADRHILHHLAHLTPECTPLGQNLFEAGRILGHDTRQRCLDPHWPAEDGSDREITHSVT